MCSLPTFLATYRPSRLIASRAAGCQPPRVSTARGRKVIPSAAHLCSYFLHLALWACSTALPPSWEDPRTSAACSGLTTMKSRAVSLTLHQLGTRRSAGLSSDPFSKPSGSLKGPSHACTAAWRRALTHGCCAIRYPPIPHEMVWSHNLSLTILQQGMGHSASRLMTGRPSLYRPAATISDLLRRRPRGLLGNLVFQVCGQAGRGSAIENVLYC